MAEDRGEAMALRLERAARRAGLHADAVRIAELFRAILRVRDPELPDPEHPDYLHPGRTALILLEDLRIADPDLLCAALLRDSERPGLLLPADEELRLAGSRAASLARSLPPADPGPADRLELLVSCDDDTLVLALAERLDHARHLHLRPDSEWRAFHRTIAAADLPAAARSHPRLAARLLWWHDNFARRFLQKRG